MGVQRTSFEKLQRDRAKKAKAAAKRERRLDRSTSEVGTETVTLEPLGADGPELTAAELLGKIELIHRQFDDGDLTFEDFEVLKADLLSRLPID